MDLLAQEYANNNNNKSSKKKIVLIALIISIILLVVLLMMISALSSSAPKKETLMVNNVSQEIKTNMILPTESGEKYISIKELANLANYEYYNGEYAKTTENKDKCYLINSNYVMGFEKESNQIYKTKTDSIIDYQYYKLENEILEYNNDLYIALKDVPIATNIIVNYDENTKQININTASYLVESSQKKYDENKDTTKIDTSINNQNAIAYNMLVISKDGKCGVLDISKKEKSETVIGTKYTTLSFDEYTQNFIASSNNKYGIIDKEGTGVIDLKYEEIKIINYNPLLYSVKQNNKYGVINKEGKTLINIEYDKIGYTEKTSTNSNPVMIIKNLKNNKNGIVVGQNNKYGIINISNGETIINCDVDAIYSKNSKDDKMDYYVAIKGKEIELDTYLNSINSKTVNITE